MKSKIAWVLLGLALICDGWLIASSTVDLPYADDYGALMDFVSDVKEHGFSWPQLWAQQNEHRPVFGRAVTLAASVVGGRMNFSILTFLGNLSWVICILILARQAYRRSGGDAWTTLAVVLLLLVPTHHENALWGISGLAFYGLTAFCLTCFFFMSEQRTAAGLAGSTLAVLTSAGGFLVFPSIFYDLFVNREWKRMRSVALWALLLGAIFFYGHHPITNPGANPHGRNLSALIIYSLCFLGGAFPTKTLAIIAGSIIAPALVIVVFRVRQARFLPMLAAFLLITTAAASWSRSNMGVEQALDSRYSIFSLIAVCCILMAATEEGALEKARRRLLLAGTGIILAIYLTVGVFQANRWELQRVKILTDFYLVINRTQWSGHLTSYLDRAKRLGLYDAWAAAAAVGRPQPSPYIPSKVPVVVARGYADVFDGAYLLGWVHLIGRDVAQAQIHLIAENDTGHWSMPVWRYDRPDLDPVFPDGGHYLRSGFQIAVADFALPPGKYRLRLLVEEKDFQGSFEIATAYEVSSPQILLTKPN